MSNALFPSTSFPQWLKDIASVNPISKTNEAARLLIVNGNLSSSQLTTFTGDVLYLIGFVIVLGVHRLPRGEEGAEPPVTGAREREREESSSGRGLDDQHARRRPDLPGVETPLRIGSGHR